VDSHSAARHFVVAIVSKEPAFMADTQFTEAEQQQAMPVDSADVVIGVAGPVAADDLRAGAARVAAELGSGPSSGRYVVAWPASSGEAVPPAPAGNGNSAVALVPFAAPPSGGEFWADVSAHQRAVLALAASLNARTCIVLGSDLAALQPQAIQIFAYAVLERQCGLVMPVYPAGKYDGLINTGILSPLHRALYGRRIRYPLTFDFAVSGTIAALLAGSSSTRESGALLWPVAATATESPQCAIGQVHIDVRHQVATGGLELSAVLGQMAGSLFQEMENDAAQWQRVRGSQAAAVWGSATQDNTNDEPIDAQPMLDSFLLGSKNLDEVWRLVLPPNTMLELRRLTRMPPEQFHMPDDLWACIVYDFALAWRLRTISRGHLLGALTPLYLGWAASYAREVAGLTRAALEQRMEQFARAWEEKKPYLLSRWRWPDRFNP
jgi:glucosylglycerate synthase